MVAAAFLPTPPHRQSQVGFTRYQPHPIELFFLSLVCPLLALTERMTVSRIIALWDTLAMTIRNRIFMLHEPSRKEIAKRQAQMIKVRRLPSG
jgi:hypothetical protein